MKHFILFCRHSASNYTFIVRKNMCLIRQTDKFKTLTEQKEKEKRWEMLMLHGEENGKVWVGVISVNGAVSQNLSN